MSICKEKTQPACEKPSLPSREELVKRLQEIAEVQPEEQSGNEHTLGAMCYRPAIQQIHKLCYSCSKRIKIIIIEGHNPYNRIYAIVRQIQEMGYDAKVKHYCPNCLKKLILSGTVDIDDMFPIHQDVKNYTIFFFRMNKEQKYHIVEMDNENFYESVLVFLQNKKSYHCYSLYTRDLDIKYIQRMTGIYMDDTAKVPKKPEDIIVGNWHDEGPYIYSLFKRFKRWIEYEDEEI